MIIMAALKIKMAITGNGQASKEQVADMLKRMLHIPEAVRNGCNIYTLGNLLEKACGERFDAGTVKTEI